MVQFMWQADLQGFANYVTDCPEVYAEADPSQGQTSDQIQVTGKVPIFLSVYEPRQSNFDPKRQQVCSDARRRAGRERVLRGLCSWEMRMIVWLYGLWLSRPQPAGCGFAYYADDYHICIRNCSSLKPLKYHSSTTSCHQWHGTQPTMVSHLSIVSSS